MSDFFADAGAWFDQVGKDIDQGGQDFGETVQDGARVVGDVFHPANGPSGDEIVDQIESTIGQQPTPDYITGLDFNEPAPALPSPITGPDFNEPAPALPSPITGPDFNEPAPALPSPITGPDFNEPAPALPSPGFKTFDPLTNPNPGLSSAFEFSEVGYDALSIDCINDSVLSLLNPEEIGDLMNYLQADLVNSMAAPSEVLA